MGDVRGVLAIGLLLVGDEIEDRVSTHFVRPCRVPFELGVSRLRRAKIWGENAAGERVWGVGHSLGEVEEFLAAEENAGVVSGWGGDVQAGERVAGVVGEEGAERQAPELVDEWVLGGRVLGVVGDEGVEE